MKRRIVHDFVGDYYYVQECFGVDRVDGPVECFTVSPNLNCVNACKQWIEADLTMSPRDLFEVVEVL